MEKFKIRPYARLLSMLGEQLIKNETVALTELVKNAYDADATLCKVRFENFDNAFIASKLNGRIIVEDNGYGMSYDIMTTHFLNPATPIKKLGKQLRQSKKGRICQGEKGIGRFAVLKLGRNVTILSKEKESDIVHKVIFDFGKYDDEFLSELEKASMLENGTDALFLDQIEIQYEATNISEYVADEHPFYKYGAGTTIIIDHLKGEWGLRCFNEFKDGLLSFTPFELDESGEISDKLDFEILLLQNGQPQDYRSGKMEQLRDIVVDKAIYKVTGSYSEKRKRIVFSYSEEKNSPQSVIIDLSGKKPMNQQTIDFMGLWFYRNKAGIKELFEAGLETECGDFNFSFYIFDFDSKQYDKFGLNNKEKEIIREHRIFLYRDGIRVQPYGAKDDDWLEIDRHRAEVRAGDSFGNNQMLGQIRISKNDNKNLRDKTSREGIIEDNKAFNQLKALAACILMYMRVKPNQTRLARESKKKELANVARVAINENVAKLKEVLRGDKPSLQMLESLERTVTSQEESFAQRLKITEQLAGVGLSVEMASHDLMLYMDRLNENIRQIAFETQSPLTCDLGNVHKNAEAAEGMMGQVYMKMKDLQQLFVSSKQRPKLVTVADIAKKIESIYKKAYSDKGIQVKYVYEPTLNNSPVKAKVMDAVLFQVFINLFDNALYWTEYSNSTERVVTITFDGTNQRMIFSDNGPGIQESDAPFIFEAFYSGKGEDGRGLGLYIAKKLIEKSGFEIDLITNEKQKISCGANFVISFVSKEA